MENTIGSGIKWSMNRPASEVGFRFRYLLFTVTGSFKDFNIEVESKGEDFSTASFAFNAKLSSLDTHNAERDKGVKEYLISHNLPDTLSFHSNKIEKLSEHNFKVEGEITILNISKPLSLNMQFEGMHRTPGDKVSTGFTVTGKLEYLDFVPEDSGIRKVAFALNKTIDIEVTAKLDKASLV